MEVKTAKERTYSREEIQAEVLVWAGRTLPRSTFYKWLPYVLIPRPKSSYTWRDVKKFIFIAEALKEDRSLEKAHKALIDEIANNPKEWE